MIWVIIDLTQELAEYAPVETSCGRQPWEMDRFRLWSLFDMLQFSAHGFFWSGAALRTISGDCLAGSLTVHAGQPVYVLGQDLDEQAREKALAMLGSVADTFRKIGMAITADTVNELTEELQSGDRYSFEWLHTQVRAIEKLAEKELRNKAFFYVSPERSKFWPTAEKPHLFGAKAAAAFPSADFDIANAGICLATGMATASVFHLMRVLEIGLTALGAKFGVSLAHTNWAPAISDIEKRIRELHLDPVWKVLPDCKEQQSFYAQAAIHFGLLKDAWRNHTMHVRAKYTEREAEQIFSSVKAFMKKLSERLSE